MIPIESARQIDETKALLTKDDTDNIQLPGQLVKKNVDISSLV